MSHAIEMGGGTQTDPRMAEPRSSAASDERGRALLLWGAAVALSVLFWPAWSLVPLPGLDPSWRTGLSWAADLGYQWGPQVAFTFGPFAYSVQPMMLPVSQVVVASALHVGATVMLVVSLDALIRAGRQVSDAMAIILALVLASLCLSVAGLWSPLLPVAVTAGLLGVLRSSHAPIALAALASAVIAHQKWSDAAIALAFGTLCAFGARRLWGVVVFLAVLVSSWTLLWIGLGQELSAIPEYVVSVYEIVSGYQAAMSLETPGREWHYVAAAAAVIALSAQLAGTTRHWARSARLCAWLATGAAVWLAFRAAFVRHDRHDDLFFGFVLIIAAAWLAATGRRRSLIPGALAAALAYAFLSTNIIGFTHLVDRTSSLRDFARVMSVLTSETVRDRDWASALDKLKSAYELDQDIIDKIADAPVLADPSDISAIRITEGKWAPIPALQLVNSYTPRLDAQNAESLREAPRLILRRIPYLAVDGRLPEWESPLYQQEVYCRYHIESHSPRWQLLAPSGVSICGNSEDVSEEEFRAGDHLEVPYRPGSITLASILPRVPLAETMAGLLFKSPQRFIEYGTRTWRMPASPRLAGVMLNTPVYHPSFVGLPIKPYSTISFSFDGTVRFAYVDVDDEAPSLGAPADAPTIDALVFSDASSVPATTVPVSPDEISGVLSSDEHSCTRLTPVGEDPWAVLSVAAGSRLYLYPEVPGVVQVFVKVDGRFSEPQSQRFRVDAGLHELRVPDRPYVGPWTIRVDPPLGGDTLVCLESALTEGEEGEGLLEGAEADGKARAVLEGPGPDLAVGMG